MKRFPIVLLVLVLLSAALMMNAQSSDSGYKSQEVSETDGIPVLIKHLPDWEIVGGRTKITNLIGDVRKEFENPAVLASVELDGGAEAAITQYSEGKLLLIEYPTPQGSTAADTAIQAKLAESPNVVYRRIGNYNALMFNAADAPAANALLDKIEYGKSVQWLGEDPFLLQKFERYIANTGRDVAISTVLFIVGILLTAILIGVTSGFVFFRVREQQRAHRTAFSDAGGLTRLNLDDLSE